VRTYTAALLLRSRVLRQPPQGSRPSAPKACEGVMITSDTLKDLPPMRFDLSRVVGCAATRWSAARPLLSYLIA
jgi:hypothetical protein